MEYTTLTDKDFEALRLERLTTLEAEHYRLTLLLLETSNADVASEILARQADYERRIVLHRAAAKVEEPEQASVDS